MAELQVGDRVFDEHGRPCSIVAATGVMYDRPCYEVEFSDRTVIVADAQHQWRTTTRAGPSSARTAGRTDRTGRQATSSSSPTERPLSCPSLIAPSQPRCMSVWRRQGVQANGVGLTTGRSPRWRLPPRSV